MAEVYWIHLPEHTDMFSEGYIGFTSKTAKHRFSFHVYKARANKDNITVCNAIRKYGDALLLKTLCIGSKEYCLYLEKELRPSPNIGWNISIGGDTPHNLGRKLPSHEVSDETKQKLRLANLGKKQSDETKLKQSISRKEFYRNNRSKRLGAVLSEDHKERISEWSSEYWKCFKDSPWASPTCNKNIWLSAESLYEEFLKTGVIKEYFPSGNRFNPKTIKLRFKSGWIPSKDLNYLLWKENHIRELGELNVP